MKAVIQNIEYEVRFRHTRLPGHDKRVMPTITDAVALLSIVDMCFNPDIPTTEIAGRLGGTSLRQVVRGFQDAYVGACITKSHSTDCYILDADRSKSFETRLVSSGQTFCDKMDNFDRAEGRFFSFSKAIDAFPMEAQQEWLEWFVDSGMRLPKAIAQCAKPPAGWRCTRGFHKDGPCAAVAVAA